MRLNRFTTAILLPGLLFTCTRCSVPTPISGNIVMKAGWKPFVYLVAPREFSEIASSFSGMVLDSAQIGEDGRFAFSKLPIVDEKFPILYQLVMQPEGSLYPNQFLDDNPLLANYMPIVLKSNNFLRFTAGADRFQASFRIESPLTVARDETDPGFDPNVANAALLKLRDIRHASYLRWQTQLEAAKTPDENTLLEQEEAVRQFRLPLMQFADTTNAVWAALVATRWVSPQQDYERVPEFLHGQCQRWTDNRAAAHYIFRLCEKANNLPLLVNADIPDFPFPMSSGDTVSLKSLLGKKLTILDIWASWCVPCRRENREVLTPLWAAYRKNGMQIIGYSIDSSEGAWRNAIAKDGAVWPHASHLSGDETPFMEVLRISTIPANFILDGNGKVVAKNLHGEALKAFVEEFLKK